MLYGETNVQHDALKRWANNLVCPSIERIEKAVPSASEDDLLLIQRVLGSQIEGVKLETNDLKENDDWRNLSGIFSRYFYKFLVCYRENAIRIANYYECFIAPAEPLTSKAIIEGYPDTLSEIGGVGLYEDGNLIGHIGQKSDLIWSAYFDYFIVENYMEIPPDEEDEEPYVFSDRHHTLANHEEVLSLQLWNAENMTDDEIDNYINKILLEVSSKFDLKFQILTPNELWKKAGKANQYQLELPTYKYDEIPALYLNHGLNSTNDRMSFLLLYQVLEYYFVRAQILLLKELLGTGGIDGKADSDIHKALNKYGQSQKESVALAMVIKHCIDPDMVRKHVNKSEKLRKQYTENSYGRTEINLNIDSKNNEKLLERLASRIYFFRCAIAHAKGDTDEYTVLPTLNKSEVSEELPLLRMIALEVLKRYSQEAK